MKSITMVCLVLLSFTGFLNAQTVKTDVLVFGTNAAAVSAAIQASRSGVKTMLIAESGQLGKDITSASKTFSGGLWAEFMKRVREVKKDSNAIPDAATTASVLKGITDTVKNLTVRYNSGIRKIEKSGKGWDVRLSDNKTSVKASAVIDATPNGYIASAAGITYDSKAKSYKTTIPAEPITKLYGNNLYRTSVGVGLDIKTNEPYIISLGSFVAEGQANFFITGRLTGTQSSADAMFTGQAAGASAAYCAFFKATTKQFNENAIRVTQGELLHYKSILVPYTDITTDDRDFTALQHIGLTGILKAKQAGKNFLFLPDSTVSSEELRAVMKEYYSRSQIWFIDKDIKKLTVADVLSLFKYVGSRGEELNREVEQAWKAAFKFKGSFDLKHQVTRREVAVLLQAYLKPFNVRVNLNGNLGS